jgi:predicted signal transduction protein with EAL and GGDEF domain
MDHLSEIAWMKLSPLNLIYKVWSRAPGFRKAGSGKYRKRKEIEFALYSYKKTSKGTDREFLFSSIKDDTISSVEELEKKFDRFRKAGYGQALKEKYRPLINLIYRKSFLSKM